MKVNLEKLVPLSFGNILGVRSGMSSFRIRWTYTNLDGSNKGKTIAEKVQCNKRRKQLWPEKFQNKTNGVTPRRWLHFCNPELRKLITKWIGTEDWVLNTDKLAGLRKNVVQEKALETPTKN
nr:PREDICTED: glycogen phosphorylase, liver form-like isoform X2 [Daucus carota subsp. sativus]